jgi:hypothetical protein
MKRTTTALLILFALTGCRFFEQKRHAVANKFASAVVRGLIGLQSSAPADSPRASARLAARLANRAPLAAAAVAGVVAPLAKTPSPAVAVPLCPVRQEMQFLPLPSDAWLRVSLAPAPKKQKRFNVLCRVRTATLPNNPLSRIDKLVIRVDENGNVSL